VCSGGLRQTSTGCHDALQGARWRQALSPRGLSQIRPGVRMSLSSRSLPGELDTCSTRTAQLENAQCSSNSTLLHRDASFARRRQVP
jgi:hypothetical protein